MGRLRRRDVCRARGRSGAATGNPPAAGARAYGRAPGGRRRDRRRHKRSRRRRERLLPRARQRHDRGTASRACARSAYVALPRAGAEDPGTSAIGHGPPPELALAHYGSAGEDRRMKGAGIREIGGQVQLLELPDPPNPKPDEIVIEVRAAGAANWDEIVRTGGWDVGIKPPMSLGVSASGVVRAVGKGVRRFQVGDDVLTHPLPLRHQGAWAQQLVAAESTVAHKPTRMSWEEAGVFPVPALTASQVLTKTVEGRPGEFILIHGAGGLTGGTLVPVPSDLGA